MKQCGLCVSDATEKKTDFTTSCLYQKVLSERATEARVTKQARLNEQRVYTDKTLTFKTLQRHLQWQCC